ncbi:hypothetical protein [Ramlibacter rhizophilus]|uniref:DUF2092 domain-containing protein n=1 Tax=Ramlibacter rhizophilus TaxID=1781167 RepID=A0A4Z0BGX2_9BURK|nr:hypothetical protein [Ramlibacter rhizophilus]TFY98545.1 hypothetical protein EZ242_13475 [Ramlibacter rhizophilus]
MKAIRQANARALLATMGLLAGLAGAVGPAGASESLPLGATHLVAVLRESAGENKQDEALQPWGKVTMQLEDGREMEIEASWYHYLGDMHIRLVFDGPQKLQSATPEDLARLRLDADQALRLAAGNLRRIYGEPRVSAWEGGLMRVDGRASDLNSSYFLDRDFWLALQQRHPQGLVAAVPQRGGLVFAPADDEEAVTRLRFGAVALYAGARNQRVSSALYLFRDGRWSVFQPPLAH